MRPLAVAVFHVATICSCSHFSPYYRADRPRSVPAIDDAEVDYRLLLVGDAGEPALNGEPTLRLLRYRVGLLPERTSVVFLGDNIYERGMPDPIEKEKDTAAGAPGEDETVPKESGEQSKEPAVESKAEEAGEEVAEEVEKAADVAADVADVVLPDIFESRQEAEASSTRRSTSCAAARRTPYSFPATTIGTSSRRPAGSAFSTRRITSAAPQPAATRR